MVISPSVAIALEPDVDSINPPDTNFCSNFLVCSGANLPLQYVHLIKRGVVGGCDGVTVWRWEGREAGKWVVMVAKQAGQSAG